MEEGVRGWISGKSDVLIGARIKGISFFLWVDWGFGWIGDFRIAISTSSEALGGEGEDWVLTNFFVSCL